MELKENDFQVGFRNSGKQVCFYCGGTGIVTGLHVHQTTTEPGGVGLAYKAWKVVWSAEELYADLCPSCGTVLRFYVKERNRDWIRDAKLK